MIRRSGFLFLFTIKLAFTGVLAQDTVKAYLANDDHTDFFWTANATTYHKVFLETLDYYLDLADETENNTAELQSRWNCDGSYWMWIYEKNRSKEQFERLISRIADGHISVPLNALTVCMGSTPVEGVIRGMYYPGRIGRHYNLEFPLVYQIENQTLAYGLGSLWAGSGAKYSWTGVCGCDTRIRNLDKRENYIYWWLGPDSSKMLMKWYPLVFYDGQSFGGYAEARQLWRASQFLNTPEYRDQYPYNIIGLFGKGWDDLETMTREFNIFSQFESSGNVKYIVSNEIDFFQDFEKTYDDILPYQSLGFGNEWELYTSYMQETTSRMLRSIERLRSAEALTSLVSLHEEDFMDKYTASRDSAWMNIGLFWEHDWGMDHREYFVPERIRWQNEITAQVENYVNRLYRDAKTRLGGLIANNGRNTRFFVFNPLGFLRDDYVDLNYDVNSNLRVVDITTEEEIPFQVINDADVTKIRIMAKGVPSMGYKIYEVREGRGDSYESVGQWDGKLLETPFHKIKFSENGAIESLISKDDNKEWVKIIDGRAINDLGESRGEIILENNGCVSATIRIESFLPLAHSTRITVYKDIPRIDIENEITENFEGNYNWAFSFNLDSPQVWHEEVGAVVKADLSENGGYLSSRNARYDWLTIGHFADISDGETGVTISSPDCNFMQLGQSTTEYLDIKTPQIKILAGADSIVGVAPKPYIRNQGGACYFLQRFALITHNEFQKMKAMRFSLEHQNPLVCGVVKGGEVFPEKNYSLIQIDNPNVLLWTLKPAEEGFRKEGLVARVWNLGNNEETFTLSTNTEIMTAKKLTHLETPIQDMNVYSNKLNVKVNRQQLVTFSFNLKRK